MKTVMTEWIEWLQAYEYELPLELQVKAKELLEKEKKQIVKAYNEDLYGGLSGHRMFNDGDEYYQFIYGGNK